MNWNMQDGKDIYLPQNYSTDSMQSQTKCQRVLIQKLTNLFRFFLWRYKGPVITKLILQNNKAQGLSQLVIYKNLL